MFVDCLRGGTVIRTVCTGEDERLHLMSHRPSRCSTEDRDIINKVNIIQVVLLRVAQRHEVSEVLLSDGLRRLIPTSKISRWLCKLSAVADGLEGLVDGWTFLDRPSL
jgi:hypothetical protein